MNPETAAAIRDLTERVEALEADRAALLARLAEVESRVATLPAAPATPRRGCPIGPESCDCGDCWKDGPLAESDR